MRDTAPRSPLPPAGRATVRRAARARVPLAAAAATLALAVPLAGCTSSGTAGGGSSVGGGRPVSGGTLRVAVPYSPTCLDPHQGQADALFARPLLDSLVYADAKGEPFDAAAVKANLDHVVAPATTSADAAQLIGTYRSATVISSHVVSVALSSPASSFLAALSAPGLGIEAPKTLTQGDTALCEKVVGTGPFTSAGGFTTQQGITYTRRAGYRWGPSGSGSHTGPAYLRKIDVRVAPDNSSRTGSLTSGQIDVAGTVAPVDVSRLRADSRYQVLTATSPGVPDSYNPNTQRGILRDKRVRTALREGIDYSLIVKKLYFGVHPSARGPLSPSTPGYDPAVAPAYGYDRAAAAKLLDRAGWTGRDKDGYRTKNGKRLSLEFLYVGDYFAPYTALATQIQAAAKQLGVQIKDENLDVGSYVKRVLAGDYDLLNSSATSFSPDALRLVFDSTHIPTGKIDQNAARYDNPTVDAALHKALATPAGAAQNKLYARVQQQVTDDAAILPLFDNEYVLGAARTVHGIGFEEQSFPVFYNTWIGK
jgi:peptide/nickel transport system substrate-binding protein